jgi:hypothetical protein
MHRAKRALLAYAPLRLPPCSSALSVEIVKLLVDDVGDVGHQGIAAVALVEPALGVRRRRTEITQCFSRGPGQVACLHDGAADAGASR